MKETVIIKLYRNDMYCDDYHDLCLGSFEERVKDIKTFSEKIGKKILFTVCKAADMADFTCFAEISYNTDLTEEEKQFYLNILKEFCRDGEDYGDEFEDYQLPLTVVLKKCDIIELVDL